MAQTDERMSHLEIHRPVLVCDMQHQVTQHLLPSEFLHDFQGFGSVGLHRVVKIPRTVHGGDCDSGEIRVACGAFLPHWTMHAGGK